MLSQVESQLVYIVPPRCWLPQTYQDVPKTHFGSPLGLDPTGQNPIHPSLTSQDVQTKSSLSVVTDNILDIRALLGNVSLINEIYFIFNPIWVKCGLVSAGAISSNVFLGVIDSHSPHQDSTKILMNISLTQILGQEIMTLIYKVLGQFALCSISILWILRSSSVIGSPNQLPITYLPDVDMAVNAVPV